MPLVYSIIHETFQMKAFRTRTHS